MVAVSRQLRRRPSCLERGALLWRLLACAWLSACGRGPLMESDAGACADPKTCAPAKPNQTCEAGKPCPPTAPRSPRDAAVSGDRDAQLAPSELDNMPARGRDAGAPLQPDVTFGECRPACDRQRPICENGACVECASGSKRCDGATPLTCDAQHRWQPQPACEGERPVCGAGVCSAYALHGGIVGPADSDSAAPVGLRVIDQRLEGLAFTCGDVNGERLCVRGTLRP